MSMHTLHLDVQIINILPYLHFSLSTSVCVLLNHLRVRLRDFKHKVGLEIVWGPVWLEQSVQEVMGTGAGTGLRRRGWAVRARPSRLGCTPTWTGQAFWNNKRKPNLS